MGHTRAHSQLLFDQRRRDFDAANFQSGAAAGASFLIESVSGFDATGSEPREDKAIRKARAQDIAFQKEVGIRGQTGIRDQTGRFLSEDTKRLERLLFLSAGKANNTLTPEELKEHSRLAPFNKKFFNLGKEERFKLQNAITLRRNELNRRTTLFAPIVAEISKQNIARRGLSSSRVLGGPASGVVRSSGAVPGSSVTGTTLIRTGA